MLLLRQPYLRTLSMLYMLLMANAAFAQNVGTIQGTVTDDTGAIIPGATVSAVNSRGIPKTAGTNENGAYTINGLAPGVYTIRITTTGFAPFDKPGVEITSGRPVTLDAPLKVALAKQEVTVKGEQLNAVSTDPSANAGALILRGEDLEALSDDPDDLAADLQALAGPSAGPNGGQIFIDGFSGAQLPPKSSIREIRINSNPFSSEYDRLGFGRIEIFTKPGTDKFHGSGSFGFSDGVFNSRNPFAPNKPSFQQRQYGGNIGGPLSKKSSFFLDIERREVDDNAVINATILDDNLNITPYSQSVVTPHRRLNINPRIDYAINANNTIVGRYGFLDSSNQTSGIGDLSLLSRGVDTGMKEHTVQITETAVLSPKAINELRFQYLHIANGQTAQNLTPSINVGGAFNGGGSQVGLSNTGSNHFEVTNIVSMAHGTHAFKFGGRVRTVTNDSNSPQNFGGSYVFGGGQGVQLDSNNQIVSDASGNPVILQLSSIERYRRTLFFQRQGVPAANIRNLYGGGANQFSISGGNPLAEVDQVDLGVFAQDDWRVKPNLTLSLGLRYETQTNIHDWADFAPRFGFAYAPGSKGGKAGKTVIRGGFGMFYDRISESLTLSTIRNNGIRQQQYLVNKPDFFPRIPSTDELQALKLGQTIRQFEGDLRAPYVMQTAIGVERQLPNNTTIAVTYTRSHALHVLRSRNITAPLPGSGGVPTNTNTYQYESNGRMNQNQMIVNLNSRINPKISIFTFYVLNSAKSDTDGAGSFPSNQYDTRSEYGRSSIDVRNRFVLGGSVVAPWNLRFSPFVIASSGSPFNITTGSDVNGDSLYTDRPSFATSSSIRPLTTQFGLFDPSPGPNAVIIPRNYGDGPGQFTVNLRVGRTWGFGEKTSSAAGMTGGDGGGGGPRGGGDHGGHGGPGGGGGGMRMGGGGMRGGMDGGNSGKRYNLTLSLSARNLLNHLNPGSPIGDLSSPRFGTSNSIAGGGFGGPGGGGGQGGGGGGGGGAANNRRLELQLRFSF